MKLTDETKDGVLVLTPLGRIDTRTNLEFEQGVKAHVFRPDGATQVVLNCRGLDYMNSTGVRVLLMLAKRVAGAKGKLVLCELREHILEVLAISGFNQVLTIVDTEVDALKHF